MIDRKSAREEFLEYTDDYDMSNSMISLKVAHTFRVADNCESIAKSLGMNDDDVDFAYLTGLLHDIGRFEQVRRYGTYVDAQSIDHAEFGADLLFKDNLISRFPVENLTGEDLILLERAIRLHNKLTVPDELDERSRCFCDLIRDADKVDIFRVITETPIEGRMGTSKGKILESGVASREVMECVMEHRCVPRGARQNIFDVHMSHGCMAFELVFDKSRELCRQQGCLDKVLAEYDENGKPLWTTKQMEQIRILRDEIEKAWGEKK